MQMDTFSFWCAFGLVSKSSPAADWGESFSWILKRWHRDRDRAKSGFQPHLMGFYPHPSHRLWFKIVSSGLCRSYTGWISPKPGGNEPLNSDEGAEPGFLILKGFFSFLVRKCFPITELMKAVRCGWKLREKSFQEGSFNMKYNYCTLLMKRVLPKCVCAP